MKKLYLIFFTLILSSCYTEFEKRSRTLEEIIEISDSTVFFPTKDFYSSDYKIKNLYRKWKLRILEIGTD